MQDEHQNSDTDAQEGTSTKMPDEANTLENLQSRINVIQQNALIMSGHKVKGDQSELDESDSERWL